MPYNSQITRSDSAALAPEEVSREIIQGVAETSAVMRLGRRLPNMSRSQVRMPVLSALMTAYFVSADTGLKQTTETAWANKYLNAEELAVIVPIPEAVLDDVDYDIWGEVKPRIAEAMGKAFDQAVLYGTNAPGTWPADLTTGATAAGNTVSLAASTDVFDATLGVGGTLALVEADGFMVSGHVAAMSMKAQLRGLRDANGQPIFMVGQQSGGPSLQGLTRYELDGAPIEFPRNGSIIPGTALMHSGDWTQLVWSMRQDITYKVLTEAVITDGSGAIIYNLPQQDMVALRAVMRLGWQLPNPINALQAVEANRYPFGVLLP